MWLLVGVFIALTFLLAAGHAHSAGHASYVAAVFEHHVILNPEPRAPLSRAAALQHMQNNLDIYEEQAAMAAQQVENRLLVSFLTYYVGQ